MSPKKVTTVCIMYIIPKEKLEKRSRIERSGSKLTGSWVVPSSVASHPTQAAETAAECLKRRESYSGNPARMSIKQITVLCMDALDILGKQVVTETESTSTGSSLDFGFGGNSTEHEAVQPVKCPGTPVSPGT
ncbi:hypothetical protein MPTK1_3g02460 [Marchantia polymorpha subsp. ruderalis]|uniref:Uncharacterized protein n=2 Tax=Marchantia polymorpha TaxID=3197 RepID=A0AAF6AWQ1_MARPO|nr:hypothetical protein MARPO_0007s0235 [Marchantia polymorpha]PTQ47872.1 hypothetical protein MARPO_0007s0235 [Marchantia polymorpha]BBN04184.1 hypothetical protein Mp_3g02460 [Marchantia polymorpha subsp. ruderalis]BBN04185.1 hypothetical protein Mp_3g02460 [Marchantia polymorpha subsp. ruderalis]|eukprot:PTQ47871.1 hypothetical protein MARPO_0007s0235 [Marchantia polymorpha]